MADSHSRWLKELKSLFYTFVFQLCSKSCSRKTFVQKRVTIKFRYLVYEKLLLSYIKNYSHEYKRNLTN